MQKKNLKKQQHKKCKYEHTMNTPYMSLELSTSLLFSDAIKCRNIILLLRRGNMTPSYIRRVVGKGAATRWP